MNISLKGIINSIVRENGEQTSPRAKSVPIEQLTKLLTTRFREAAELYLNNPKWGLYRGYNTKSVGGSKKIAGLSYIVNPKSQIRRSKETNNFYTHFISYSPNWRGYPKRDTSLIGATTENVAANYGSMIFNVVPENGAKFVVCRNDDCWASFPYASSILEPGTLELGVESIMGSISIVFSMAAYVIQIKEFGWYEGRVSTISPINVGKLMDENTESFLNVIEAYRTRIIQNIDEIKNRIENDTKHFHGTYSIKRSITLCDYIKQSASKFSSFEDLFDDLFDPKNNDIKLVDSISKMVSEYSNKGVEFWTDSECILIPLEGREMGMFSKILRKDDSIYD